MLPWPVQSDRRPEEAFESGGVQRCCRGQSHGAHSCVAGGLEQAQGVSEAMSLVEMDVDPFLGNEPFGDCCTACEERIAPLDRLDEGFLEVADDAHHPSAVLALPPIQRRDKAVDLSTAHAALPT